MPEYHMRLMRRSDLPSVNLILSKAFTAARIDDGFKNAHVPLCHLSFLEMYLAAFPAGCFVIENGSSLVGYTFSRLWGEVAWIGPVSIIPAHQGKKLGQQLMVRAIEVLKSANAKVIGLETMPRSHRNLGFYTKLGFIPQNLTVDLTLPVPRDPEEPWPADYEVVFYNETDSAEREFLVFAADALARRIDPHLSIRPEIELTWRFQYGDTMCVRHGNELLACFIAHTKTYSEEEAPRYMKIVFALMDASLSTGEILPHLFAWAKRRGLDTISVRTPTRYHRAYSELIAAGFRVFHSDLRMTLEGYEEEADPGSFYLSKWE
ncbi:MAG: GNAT family N-acetyltransferase [candidate division KSB1 bacterium]|nr:GNAT family N-acetyltransferase [candidate division KSB1 bacterium]MDZ7301541.1 GNAT family N-acetyltransferase [candidate division KSB1 bacterium]MDZ7311043.1 GNAT family N-acetyltransferase [candidate division KSB1 bacterium]